jgi:glycosyltransferase involved in cell wall biosynthesis
MASGTPVIAYKAGGALDYIRPGVTGEFFTHQTAASLATTLRRFKPNAYSSAAVRAYAKRYSREQFQKSMRAYVSAMLKKGPPTR